MDGLAETKEMNKAALTEKLDLLGINKKGYSLDGELNVDTIVMYHNYHKWEVFYLDEKGGRNDERAFATEGEACFYIYDLFKGSKKISDKFGIKS